MLRKLLVGLTVGAVFFVALADAGADLIWRWDSGDGLSASADFTLVSPRLLQVAVVNTSTAMPAWLPADTSNQFLTSISFDLGEGVQIVGGSAVLGAGAYTLGFDKVSSQLTAGANVSCEWGFSNTGDKMGLARNVITTLEAQSTRFSTTGNLDGPANLSGPQGGLLANPLLLPPGGIGGISGPVIFTLQLNRDVLTLADLTPRGGTIEFGSDAAFVSQPSSSVPEPVTVALLGVGGLALAVAARRRLVARRA